jgi:5-methylcytosine-specific restriction endonuclease McrA
MVSLSLVSKQQKVFVKSSRHKTKSTRPLCEIDGCINVTNANPLKLDGTFTFQKKCCKHRSKKGVYGYRLSYRPYLAHKKSVCERCGFVPEHEGQLDVDHIDGDHGNNEPANLQTLCANCHRLKTITKGEFGLVTHRDKIKTYANNTRR